MKKRWLILKKIAETVHGEVQKEIERIVGRYYFEKDNGGSFDLESFELAIRSSMHGIGRGMDRAKEVCVIGDGAHWIWNIADEQFYEATQIVDLYHAREHYWNVARACFGQNKDKQRQVDGGTPQGTG